MAADRETDVARLAEVLAAEFHAAYEQLAPDFGYQTRRDSAVPWENVPEPNRSLMVAAAGSVLGGSVVDAIARQRAAEELEAAAEDAEGRGLARQATAYRYAASYLRVLALPESMRIAPDFDTEPEAFEYVQSHDFHDPDELSW